MMADLPGHGQQGGLRNFDGTGREEAFLGHAWEGWELGKEAEMSEP
jgi:hypothetical protein